MKNKTIQFFVAIAMTVITALVYTGCKKDKPDDTLQAPSNSNAAADNAVADNAFSGIWKQISIVADSSSMLKSTTSIMAGNCATATLAPYDLTTWPKTLVINFGTTNCKGADSVNRRGIITAVLTKPFADSGSVITITTLNYYHNDYKIEGTQVITNKGHNSAGHLVYNVIVNSATITHPTGGVSTWNTSQKREWFAGETTNFNILDDVWLISGTAGGVSVKGESYTIVINTDLRINVGCPWIVSGQFTLTLLAYPTYPIVFDYGTPNCDPFATATFNGTTYNIILH